MIVTLLLDATELQLILPSIKAQLRRTYTRSMIFGSALACLILFTASPSRAQENYFVTYSHELEEPGNLEIEAKNVIGAPKGGNAFAATALEFEYGVKTWWTTEIYLDGQTT